MPAGLPAARSSRRWAMVLVLAAALSLSLAAPRASAGPGDLDGSFNGSGMLTKDWQSTDEVRGLAVQPDGKIIAVGITTEIVDGNPLFRFAVARFFADGTPDDGFGNGGLTVTDIGGGDSIANAAAVMADGRIVVVGTTGIDSYEVALARYTADGRLDGSFGQGGMVRDSEWSGGSDQARVVAVTESGHIVVAGVADRRRAVARYAPDGGRDGGFGEGGLATSVTLPGGTPVPALALDVRGDSSPVLLYSVTAGVRSTWQAPAEPGATLTPIGDDVVLSGGLDQVNALVAGGAGMMVVGGSREGRFSVAVHQFDGNPVDVFAGGTASADFRTEPQRVNAVAIQPDGRILVAGYAGFPADFAIARFEGIPGPTTPVGPDQTPTPEPSTPTPRPITPQPTATPQPTVPATTVPVRTPPPSTAGGTPEKGTVLFSESFDGGSGAISTTSNDPTRYRRAYLGGEFQVQQLGAANFVDFVRVPGEFSNSRIAVDARIVGQTTRRTVMLGCRFSTRGYYRVDIYPNTGTFFVYVNAGGTFRTLQSETASSAIRRDNATNRYVLSCAGPVIQLIINDVTAATIQDATLTQGQHFFTAGFGQVGINAAAEARFDNLEVTQE